MLYPTMEKEKRLSTAAVARLMKVAQPRLQKLIADGRIVAPPVIELGTARIRLWTEEEIAVARKVIKTDRRKRKAKR
jgi:hypothetical protein